MGFNVTDVHLGSDTGKPFRFRYFGVWSRLLTQTELAAFREGNKNAEQVLYPYPYVAYPGGQRKAIHNMLEFADFGDVRSGHRAIDPSNRGGAFADYTDMTITELESKNQYYPTGTVPRAAVAQLLTGTPAATCSTGNFGTYAPAVPPPPTFPVPVTPAPPSKLWGATAASGVELWLLKPLYVRRILVFASDSCAGSIELFTETIGIGTETFTGAGCGTARAVTFPTSTLPIIKLRLLYDTVCGGGVQALIVEGAHVGTAALPQQNGLLGSFPLDTTHKLYDQSTNGMDMSAPSPVPIPQFAGTFLSLQPRKPYQIGTPVLSAAANSPGFTVCVKVSHTADGEFLAVKFSTTDILRLSVKSNQVHMEWKTCDPCPTHALPPTVSTVCGAVDVAELRIFVSSGSTEKVTAVPMLQTRLGALASPSVTLGGKTFSGRMSDVAMYSWAFGAYHFHRLLTGASLASRVEQEVVWSPIPSSNRVHSLYSSALAKRVDAYWCKPGASLGSFTCNGRAPHLSGVWMAPLKSSATFSLAVKATAAQDVGLVYRGIADVQVFVHHEGAPIDSDPATFTGGVPADTNCLFQLGGDIRSNPGDRDECDPANGYSPQTQTISLKTGWSTLIVQVVNMQDMNDGFILEVEPTSDLLWAYVAPPSDVVDISTSVTQVKVVGICNAVKETIVDVSSAGGTGKMNFGDNACMQTQLTIDHPGVNSESSPFQVVSDPVGIRVTGKVAFGTVLETRREYIIEMETLDEDGVFTHNYNENASLSVLDYDWGDIHTDEWHGVPISTTIPFESGRIKVSFYFARPGDLTLVVRTTLPEVTHNVSVVNHRCTEETCPSPNECDPEYGCICNQAGDGSFDRRTGCKECLAGYAGSRCKFVCPGLPDLQVCGGHGVCNDGVAGNGLCKCDETAGHWAEPTCVECAPGFWGADCLAACPKDCTLAAKCDAGVRGTGKCTCNDPIRKPPSCEDCLEGYAKDGDACKPCPNMCSKRGTCAMDITTNTLTCTCTGGYAGVDCSDKCTETANGVCGGSARGSCVEGKCVCTETFTGIDCSSCIPSMTNAPECNVQCQGPVCPTGEDTCAAPLKLPCNGRGTCDTTASNCSCPVEYVGEGCEFTCPVVDKKVCNGNGACEVVRGAAACKCKGGYTGVACELCTTCTAPTCVNCNTTTAVCMREGGVPQCKCFLGYYGQDCSSVCDCGVDDTRCDPATGACDCSIKAPASVVVAGPTCSDTCPDECGGHGTCDLETATCTCHTSDEQGWWGGANCTSCSDQFFGNRCDKRCDNVTGTIEGGETCTCSNNFYGSDCTFNCVNGKYDEATNLCKCDESHFGASCRSKCTEDCPAAQRVCSEGGMCVCKGNLQGLQCDECADGYYTIEGSPEPCTGTCCSMHGKCNVMGLACKCFADPLRGFWDGAVCDKCVDNYFGADCKELNLQVTSLTESKAPNATQTNPLRILHTDPTTEAIVAGGLPFYTTVAPHQNLVQHTAATSTDAGMPCVFMHVHEGVALLLYAPATRDGGTTPPVEVHRCDWKAGGDGVARATGCQSVLVVPYDAVVGKYSAAAGQQGVIVIAYEKGVRIYNPQSTTHCSVVTKLDSINTIAIVGSVVAVGGKRGQHWDINVYSLQEYTTLVHSGVGGFLLNPMTKKVGKQDTVSWRDLVHGSATVDDDTSRALCYPTSDSNAVWSRISPCAPKYLRKVSVIAAVDNATFVACLQGNSGETKMAKFHLDTGVVHVTQLDPDASAQLGLVNSIAVDLPGDQLFVNHLTKARGLLHRVQLSDFRLRGRTDSRFLSIAVQPTERLLWGLSDRNEVTMMPMLLSAVGAVTPIYAHITGGTVVTVSGMAFLPLPPGSVPECRIGTEVVPAKTLNVSSVACSTPPASACQEQAVTVSVHDPSRRWFTSDLSTQVTRIAMPTLVAVSPELTPNETGQTVTIQVEDAFNTPFVMCNFSKGRPEDPDAEWSTVPARLMLRSTGTYVRCSTPYAGPRGVGVSLDGQQFTDPIFFVGPAAHMTAEFNKTTMPKHIAMLTSSARTEVPPLLMSLFSAENVELGNRARYVYHVQVVEEWRVDYPDEATPGTLQTGAPCTGGSSQLTEIPITEGAGTVCGLFYAWPPRGSVKLNITQVQVHNHIESIITGTTLSITILPGEPSTMELPPNGLMGRNRSLGEHVEVGVAFVEGGTVDVQVLIRDGARNPVDSTPHVSAYFMQAAGPEWVVEPQAVTPWFGVAELTLYDAAGLKRDVSVVASPGFPEIAGQAKVADGTSLNSWAGSTSDGMTENNTITVVSAGAFALKKFSIVPDRETAFIRWELSGSTDGSAWETLHATLVDAETSEMVESQPSNTQHTMFRLVIQKVVVPYAKGLPEDQGYVRFTELAPRLLIHLRVYKVVVHAGPDLLESGVTTGNITTALCDDSTYQKLNTGECEACPEHAQCNGTEIMFPNPGYWRPNNMTTEFSPCPLTEACLGAACAEHSGGVLCGECEAGYYANHFQKTCTECAGSSSALVAIVAAILLTALVVLSLAHLFSEKLGAVVWFRILIDHMQLVAALAFVGIPSEYTRDWFEGVNLFEMSVDEFSAMRCAFSTVDSLDYYLLGMAIPLLALPCAVVVWIVHKVYVERKRRTYVGKRIADYREAPIGPDAVGDSSPHAVDGNWVELVEAEEEEQGDRTLSRGTVPQMVMIVLLYLVYFTYMTSVRRTASILDCVDIEMIPACENNVTPEVPYGCVPGGKSNGFLRRSPDIECNDGYHRYEAAASVLLVVYMLALPGSLFVGIRLYRDWKGESEARVAFPSMLAGYRREVGPWGLVVMFRKACVALITIFFSDASLQTYTALWVVTGALLAHVWTRPFADKAHNTTETAGLFCIVVTLNVLLLLLGQDSLVDYARGIEVVVVIFNGLIIVFMAYQLSRILRGVSSAQAGSQSQQKGDSEVGSDESLCNVSDGEFEMQPLGSYNMEPDPIPQSMRVDIPPATWMGHKGKQVRVSGGAAHVNISGRVIPMEDILGVAQEDDTWTINLLSANLTMKATPETAAQWAAYVRRCTGTLPSDLQEVPLPLFDDVPYTTLGEVSAKENTPPPAGSPLGQKTNFSNPMLFQSSHSESMGSVTKTTSLLDPNSQPLLGPPSRTSSYAFKEL
eukprot:TRINITY_DN621_c0_g1_i11.p1 TRINITY_DN621_c0_g1~~TRINITY_DN621_c0_g1_i11.p1  ORF type:complete len:3370 (+),score=1038.41 TRINITY_DN621_c0_g1_i11:736-10110(+)